MGYATLDAALAFPNNLPPSNSQIIITDTLKSDGNFLLHHFLANHLKANQRVVLVGLAQIFNHYFLISRKLGTNLQTYKQNGKFIFIDGLTHLNEYTNETPYPPSKAPTAPTDTLDHSKSSGKTLQSFYNIIAQYIDENTLLILDDLNVLLYDGYPMEDIVHFLTKLKAKGTLLAVVHADEEGEEDTEQDNFVKSVIYRSNIVLQLQPLNSGLARDVHGELDILYGPQYQLTNHTLQQSQSMHYKILDNNVHFFAKGISQA